MGPLLVKCPLGPRPANNTSLRDISQSSNDQPAWKEINALPRGRALCPPWARAGGADWGLCKRESGVGNQRPSVREVGELWLEVGFGQEAGRTARSRHVAPLASDHPGHGGGRDEWQKVPEDGLGPREARRAVVVKRRQRGRVSFHPTPAARHTHCSERWPRPNGPASLQQPLNCSEAGLRACQVKRLLRAGIRQLRTLGKARRTQALCTLPLSILCPSSSTALTIHRVKPPLPDTPGLSSPALPAF